MPKEGNMLPAFLTIDAGGGKTSADYNHQPREIDEHCGVISHKDGTDDQYKTYTNAEKSCDVHRAFFPYKTYVR